MQALRILVLGAAFVAATLQGSRLPAPAFDAGERLALRAGSGADPVEPPTARDGTRA
jgi:hypothetical protein